MSKRRIRVHASKQADLLEVPPLIEDQSIRKRLRKRLRGEDPTFIYVPEVDRSLKLRHIIDGRPESPMSWVFLPLDEPRKKRKKNNTPNIEGEKEGEIEEEKKGGKKKGKKKRAIVDEEETVDMEDSDFDPDEPEGPQYDEMIKEFRKTAPAMANRLEETIAFIKKRKPSPLELLSADLLLEDRADLLEMFEVFASTDYPSEEHIDRQKKLIAEFDLAKRKYRDYQLLSDDVKSRYPEESKRLLGMNSSLSVDYQIVALDAPDAIKAHIFREYMRLKTLGSSDDEKPKLERWVDTCLALPYRRFKHLPDDRGVFLRQMKDMLDREVYGMEKVKEQLLIFTNARLSNPQMKECTLGLIGPPGIGKTMIARLMSTCLTLPFSQISCGGITEPDVIKGYAYTYIGSRPGELVNSLIEMKFNNGVIFFDEFEKISGVQAITSMLLHVLDPSQNAQYQDSYLGKDIKIDLSGIWFILSMNDLPADSALRDRIYPIYMDGYDHKEKREIAKRHLIPKICLNMKVPKEDIIFPDEAIDNVIMRVCKDVKGVRALNHALREIMTKIYFLQKSNIPMSFTIKHVQTPYTITADAVGKLITEGPEPSWRNMYN